MKLMSKLLALFLVTFAASADEIADSRKAYQAAAAAYRANDFPQFETLVTRASSLRPHHPTLVYKLAAAKALNGKRDEAFEALERVAAMGAVFDLAKDDDFKSLRDDSRFLNVVKRFEQNGEPAGSPVLHQSLRDNDAIGEGLIVNGTDVVVSFVHAKMILTGDRQIDLPAGGFGMRIDPKRRSFWVATAQLPQVGGFALEAKGNAALVEIDPRTRKIRRTFEAGEGEHLFGDLVLARNGEVFVSDSATPTIFRLREGNLEPFVTGGFASLQGLAFNQNESLLYVADYSRGIFAIDMRTRDRRLLPTPAAATLLGIDGLYLASPNVLIATQNGTAPQRVVRITLGRGGLTVLRVETLAANHEGMTDITHGVVRGNDFYFIANSGWNLYDDDGKLRDGAKPEPLKVMKVRWR